MEEIEKREPEIEPEIEFMRKSRFEKIKNKFSEVLPEADRVIDEAKSDDILALSITFNSPITVVKAKIFDDKDFIDLAF